MQTGRNDFTFKAILDMALGSSQLTQEHLALLHCLINALLQKLNSQNEIVKIKGFEAQCLVKLLKECQDPPYECKINNDQCIGSKFEKLVELEQRSENICRKLENHFDLGRSHKHILDKLFSGERWDFYTGNAEDICSVPGRQCIEMCSITCNGQFNQKLRKAMTVPVLQHLFDIENLIDIMQEILNETFIKSAKIFEEKNFLGPLISSTEKIRQQIDDNHKLFLVSMKEVQEMLNAKVDRIAYPAMKSYIKRYYEMTWNTIAKIRQESKSCPLQKALPKNKGTCLSCGVPKKTSSKKRHLKYQAPCPPYMALCNTQPEVSLDTRMTYLNIHLAAAESHTRD